MLEIILQRFTLINCLFTICLFFYFRNLSALSTEACLYLISNDILTPLIALFSKYGVDYDPKEEKNKSVASSADTLVQIIHLYTNLCEASDIATSRLIEDNILQLLIRYLDISIFGKNISIAAVMKLYHISAQCIYCACEDNVKCCVLLSEVSAKQMLWGLLNVDDEDLNLLKTLCAGVLFNISAVNTQFDVQNECVGKIIPVLLQSISKDTKHTIEDITELMSAIKSEKDSAKLKIKNANLNSEIGKIENSISSRQFALEILTNMCGSDDNDSNYETDDENEVDMELDTEIVNDGNEAVGKISTELHDAIVHSNLAAIVLQQSIILSENVVQILSSHPLGGDILKKMSSQSVQCLHCFHNIVSVLKIDELGGINSIYDTWLQLAEQAFTGKDTLFLDFSAYSVGSTDAPSTSTCAAANSRRLRLQHRTEREHDIKVIKDIQDMVIEEPSEDADDLNAGLVVKVMKDQSTQTNEVVILEIRDVRNVNVATDDIEMKEDVYHDHCYDKLECLEDSVQLLPELDALSNPSSLESDSEYDSNSIPSYDLMDIDYNPNLHSCDDDDDFDHTLSSSDFSSFALQDDLNPVLEDKFIVFKTQLMELFRGCPVPGCDQPLVEPAVLKERGSAITVETNCFGEHRYVWASQPSVHRIYVGNLLFPCSVFATGGSFRQAQQMLDCFNIKMIRERAAYNIQAAFIIPECEKMWQVHQQNVLESICDKQLELSGDARCDSPGHCASLGTYSMLDTKSNLIVEQQTVHVTEVKNSYWLEPQGLERCLKTLKEKDANIRLLATDRHLGITKFMRNSHPEIKHEFDLWHIVKGLKKKLSKSKEKHLQPWVNSIANHLWYCADTCGGDPDLLIEKWLSVLFHVCNQHSWITGEKFHRCEHGLYSRKDAKSTPWLRPESQAHETLQKVVTDKNLLSQLHKVTEGIHTGNLESIHSLYNKYATKRLKFGSAAFKARLRLAALDHNMNAERNQAVTRDGKKMYKLQYSKASKDYVLKDRKEKKQYNFRTELLHGVMNRCSEALSMKNVLRIDEKMKTIGEHAAVEKPTLTAAIEKRTQSPHRCSKITRTDHMHLKHSEADSDLIEARSSVLRELISLLEKTKESVVCELLMKSNLELMFTAYKDIVVNTSVQTNCRVNFIRVLGSVGTILMGKNGVHMKTAEPVIKEIGVLLSGLVKDSELLLMSEALDTLIDLFSEDYTDGVAKAINLCQCIISAQVNFTCKLKACKKAKEWIHPVTRTVKDNLTPFINYKKQRLR
ncbi:HEAT repeat-containing protein 3 [Nymphon striatum]|nr:HEAT repeat-containing protein 3 [Nymphon striatum]